MYYLRGQIITFRSQLKSKTGEVNTPFILVDNKEKELKIYFTPRNSVFVAVDMNMHTFKQNCLSDANVTDFLFCHMILFDSFIDQNHITF